MWFSRCCILSCMTEPVRGRVLTGTLWIGYTKKVTFLPHRARPSRWFSRRKGLSGPKYCSRRYSANPPDDAWQLICLVVLLSQRGLAVWRLHAEKDIYVDWAN